MKSLEIPIVSTPTLTLPRQETVSQLGKGAVIPAKAGIQFLILFNFSKSWMPAFASMTNYDTVSRGGGEFPGFRMRTR
jgi:hypothetical protein